MMPKIRKRIFSNKKAFTLIEIMVAVAIMGILAGTAVVNFGKNDDRDVKQEADRLTSFLREVQNKALTGDRANISPTGKVCGFGFYFDGGGIQAYYGNSDDLLNSSCLTTDTRHNSTNAMPMEKHVPGHGVTMSTFSTDIIFMSPTGDVYEAGNPAIPRTEDFLIELTKGGSSTNVVITPNGIIKQEII